ncbi:MAG: chitobiase/beta-hexosaminidase C-terminal domain-containing protein [Spirochaetales bacterium]|nr:chitobiase/beta-hexosaminidase C-terminal domain-containing protein [Spirochaetales bacterium]
MRKRYHGLFLIPVVLISIIIFTGCPNIMGTDEQTKTLNAPEISPDSGILDYSPTVYIWSIDPEIEDYRIYYTTDGSVPDNTSILYNDGIEISDSALIRAVMYVGTEKSLIATAWYEIPPTTDTLRPKISPGYGIYEESVAVTLTSRSDAEIYYTLDGSSPESYGTLYTEPFVLTESAAVKAVAIWGELVSTDINTTYVITPIGATQTINRFFWGYWKSAYKGLWEITSEQVIQDSDVLTDNESWSTSSSLYFEEGLLVKESEDLLRFDKDGASDPLYFYRTRGYDDSFSFTLFDTSAGNTPRAGVNVQVRCQNSWYDYQEIVSDSQGMITVENILAGNQYELVIPVQPGVSEELTSLFTPRFDEHHMGAWDIADSGSAVQIRVSAGYSQNFDDFLADGTTVCTLDFSVSNSGDTEQPASIYEISLPSGVFVTEGNTSGILQALPAQSSDNVIIRVTCSEIAESLEFKDFIFTYKDAGGTVLQNQRFSVPFNRLEYDSKLFNINISEDKDYIYESFEDYAVVLDPQGIPGGLTNREWKAGQWKVILSNFFREGFKYSIDLTYAAGSADEEPFEDDPDFSLLTDLGIDEPNNNQIDAIQLYFNSRYYGYLGDEDIDCFYLDVPETNRLVYDGNGEDSGTVPASAEYDFDDRVTPVGNPGNLIRDGFVFAGWGYSSGDANNWDTSNVLDEVHIGIGEKRLFAQWQPVISGMAGMLIVREDGALWKYNDTDEPVITGIESVYSSHIKQTASSFFAVGTDGSLWAWGGNEYGQLGTGDRIGRETPEKILDNAAKVITLEDVTLVLDTDGKLHGFGRNVGHLAPLSEASFFVSPKELALGVESFSAGSDFLAIISSDGTVSTSGRNTFGQLGRAATAEWSGFEEIAVAAQAVSAGDHHLLILKDDGTVLSTGFNSFGQLGDGSAVNRYSPGLVSGITGVEFVFAGNDTSFFLKNDGSLLGCGDNRKGLLGLGPVETIDIPTLIKEGIKDVILNDNGTYIIDTGLGLWITGYYDDDSYTYSLPDMTIPQSVTDNVLSVSPFSTGSSTPDRYSFLISRGDGSLWLWDIIDTDLTPTEILAGGE